MFEQAFKNIDDILHKEAGCTTELDYTEQTSWLLFLKYLDGLEQDLADEATLKRKKYSYILDEKYRWEQWAAPKGRDGTLDHNKALTGDDLRDFVNDKLFPYLQKIKQKASGPNTIDYKIGEIFGEIKNKITRSNTQNLVGHAAIYDGHPAKAICCDLIMKMTVDPSKALTRYVHYYLRSPAARTYLTGRAHGASSTMKKIGKQVVQDLRIPNPPIAVQKSVVSILDSLRHETQRLESIYHRKLAALDDLKKSMLHQAFTGQL